MGLADVGECDRRLKNAMGRGDNLAVRAYFTLRVKLMKLSNDRDIVDEEPNFAFPSSDVRLVRKDVIAMSGVFECIVIVHPFFSKEPKGPITILQDRTTHVGLSETQIERRVMSALSKTGEINETNVDRVEILVKPFMSR